MADSGSAPEPPEPRDGGSVASQLPVSSSTKPRITDVAQAAGVSVGTVSNVLNERPGVAPELRRRVQMSIEQLGYVRSESGRHLRTGRSRVVALVATGVSNPLLGAVATSAERVVRRAGLGLMMCNLTDGRHEASYLRMLVEQGVRGVLLAPGDPDAAGSALLRRQGIPFVVIGTASPVSDGCSVSTDDPLGGELALRHLLAAGHRRIVCVTGPTHRVPGHGRLLGAQNAYQQSGVAVGSLPRIECSRVDVESGRDAGVRLLGLSPRPTAAFCVDETLALGVLQALWAADIRVPDDIAVIGYEDTELAAVATMPMSSVRQSAAVLGRTAAELLLDETASTSRGQHRHRRVVLQPELVVRHSTRGGRRQA